MQFTVKRSEWVRGSSGTSGLYIKSGKRSIENPDRKRCCLGFFANACGIPDEVLMDSLTPISLPSKDSSFPDEWTALIQEPDGPPISYMNTILCKKLMACNDDRWLDDADREVKLTGLFSELGHTVVFVN